MFPSSGRALPASFGQNLRDTAADAWRKRLKDHSGNSISTIQAAPGETYLPFVSYREWNGYHQRLTVLLAHVPSRPIVEYVVRTDLLCFAENFRHVYCTSIYCDWPNSSDSSHVCVIVRNYQLVGRMLINLVWSWSLRQNIAVSSRQDSWSRRRLFIVCLFDIHPTFLQ